MKRPSGEVKSDGGWGGKDEVDVEGEGNGERGDVTHPRSSRFTREEGKGIRGEEKRKTLVGGEGSEVSLETVGT